MKTIWKFPLEVTDEQFVTVSDGAELLTVQVQCGQPYLWALVNPTVPHETRRLVRMVGTGHPIEDYHTRDLRYLGTIQLDGGALVFHFFCD